MGQTFMKGPDFFFFFFLTNEKLLFFFLEDLEKQSIR